MNKTSKSQYSCMDTQECKIYIEDYVVSYLKSIKAQTGILPVRLTLFGHTVQKEEKKLFFIYGAADMSQEHACGRNERDIHHTFFEKYDMIGYVNIYPNSQKENDYIEGYEKFFESNEAMQNYMIYRDKQNYSTIQRYGNLKAASITECAAKEHKLVKIIRQMFLGILISAVVLSLLAINGYTEMKQFGEMFAAAWDVMNQQK